MENINGVLEFYNAGAEIGRLGIINIRERK